jgi:hypothetical protein
MTGHRIIKNLTKRGNSVLGVGVYSAALAASNGVDAIKIGTNMDDPWLDFKGIVVEALPLNPHLPKIKTFYHDTNSEFYVCVMEKLDSVSVCSKAEKLVEACKEFVEGHHSDIEFEDICKQYHSHAPEPQVLLQALKSIKQHTTHFKYGKPANISSSEYGSDDYEPEYEGRRLDMHRGNFMMRGEVLVITDPWCNVDMDEIADLSIWADEQISDNIRWDL